MGYYVNDTTIEFTTSHVLISNSLTNSAFYLIRLGVVIRSHSNLNHSCHTQKNFKISTTSRSSGIKQIAYDHLVTLVINAGYIPEQLSFKFCLIGSLYIHNSYSPIIFSFSEHDKFFQMRFRKKIQLVHWVIRLGLSFLLIRWNDYSWDKNG
jgi:hypothetical protein